MNGELYLRDFALEISRVTKGKFFETREQARITGLRCAFNITKTLSSTPNTSEITVCNLNEASRSFVQAPRAHVRLLAGYDGDLGLLFAGDVRWAPSNLVGADWITKMELGDGLRAHKHARVSKSYAPGTDARQVLKDAAGTMGLKIPTNISEAKELLTQFTSGISISGPSEAEITKLLEPRGMSWSIQDGEMRVVRDDQSLPGEAYLVDEEHGMVDSPAYGAPAKKGGKHLLTFRTLLRPELTPGRRVKLAARGASGFFRIEKVSSVGDTRAAEWFSNIEARPL